jgi:DNA-binding transcriptional ArsR family regulator
MPKKKNIKSNEALAFQLKALSHPARLEIIKILKERDCICGELVDVLPLAQATVSQHLKVLKKAGFIIGDINGTKVCYTLNRSALESFKKDLETI